MKRSSFLLLLIFVASVSHRTLGLDDVNWDPDYSISGTSTWTKTVFRAVKGEEIRIVARGSVKHSWMSGWHGPDGNPSPFCSGCVITSKCNVAELIMRIGKTGKIYCVGSLLRGKAPADGDIYFAINDTPLGDNEGGFEIMLRGPGIDLGGRTFD